MPASSGCSSTGASGVEDWDTKTSLAYDAERDVLIRHTEPDLFDPDHRVPDGFDAPSPLTGGLSPNDDLARLFERARRGEDTVRLVGAAKVRGIDVHELEFTFTVEMMVMPRNGRVEDPRALPTRPVEFTRTIYIDRESFLPVRVVERSGHWTNTITDYVLAERLPRTDANERLLRMSPHPGAKLIVEGRL